MPPKKIDVPTGPPLAQEECPLFKLPAELRNYIYELTLTVEPDEFGDVSVVKGPRGSETVLALVGTCRLIYQEAAGIFLCQNNAYVGCSLLMYPNDMIPNSGFLDASSKLRLAGLCKLAVLCPTFSDEGNYFNGVEAVAMSCKRLRKVPALRQLTFVLGNGIRADAWKHYMNVEKPLLRRAVKKMRYVEDIRFELPDDMEEPQRETIKGQLDELVAMLPSRRA